MDICCTWHTGVHVCEHRTCETCVVHQYERARISERDLVSLISAGLLPRTRSRTWFDLESYLARRPGTNFYPRLGLWLLLSHWVSADRTLPTRRAFIRHLSLLCVLFQYSCLTRNAAAIIDVAFSAHDLGAPALSATRGLVGEENVSSKPPRPQSGSSQIRATVGLRLPAQDPITSSHRSVILLTTPGHTGVHPTQGFRIQRVCSSKSQPVRRLLASHAPSVPCP